MIPVQRQPEPEDFAAQVRQPGVAFLSKATLPIKWKNHAYWQRMLPALRHLYGSYCAYLAMKIPLAVGNPTVDHFLPKSLHPQLAYEWSNYRLASALMNTYKGESLDVLDPFELAPGWFTLDFPSLLTLPAATLNTVERQQVQRTIEILKLSHTDIRQSRKEWVFRYALGRIPFDFLAEEQPFIAQELQRQDLTDTGILRQMFELLP